MDELASEQKLDVGKRRERIHKIFLSASEVVFAHLRQSQNVFDIKEQENLK